jgi:uncharacterized protein YabE (DUF348 family)
LDNRTVHFPQSTIPHPKLHTGVIWLLVMVVFLGAAARLGWQATLAGVPVTVTVDGYRETLRTGRGTVDGVLLDLDLTLRQQDLVQPVGSTAVRAGMAITVQRARRSLISADGSLFEVYTQAKTVGDLLAQAGLRTGSHDEVSLDGQPATPETVLPAPVMVAVPTHFARPRPWLGHEAQPVRLSIRRAVRIMVDDGSVPYPIFTTAPTIGEALLGEQLTLYLGDRVQPELGTPVQAGLRVTIARSKPVLVSADGRTVRTRTRGKTVGDALAELGIPVAGSDRVTPGMGTPVAENLAVRIVRVQNLVQVESKAIPFEKILVPDDNLEIDQQQLVQSGADGEFRRRFKVTLEDGVVVTNTLADAWVAAEPITNVVSYGRMVVLRTLDTPDGQLTYWRKVRMYATSYSKSTAGVSPSASYFGITRLGLPMRKGIVAVDPTVVVLGSQLYVPGYGVGLAGDTGGGVRGKWVDLGYDDENLQSWHWWVDVYLLGSPPSAARIRWVLPNWPQFR